MEISSSKLAKIQKRTEGIQKFLPQVLAWKPNFKWVLVTRLFYLDMHWLTNTKYSELLLFWPGCLLMESIYCMYIKKQVNFILEKEEGKIKEERQLDCNKIMIWEEGWLLIKTA